MDGETLQNIENLKNDQDASLLLELTKICQAVEIASPEEVSFAGRLIPELDPTTQAQLAATQIQLAQSQNPLVPRLQYQLYLYCYCQKFAGTFPEASGTHGWYNQSLQSFSQNLIDELSAANAGRDRWDTGWQIARIDSSGQALAQKSSLNRLLWPGQFINQDGPGLPLRPGSNIRIFLPRESRTMQPGFYFAFGETLTGDRDNRNLVRFYWNIAIAGVTTLVRVLTQSLNRFQVPFRFKCWTGGAGFARSDAAVLYVNKRFYQIVAALIADFYPLVRSHLKPETPLFTKKLAPGLSLAEDPNNGESFGLNRCRLVAEGLWNAYTQKIQAEEERLNVVIQQFKQENISLERPYLSPGSVDRYDFSIDSGS